MYRTEALASQKKKKKDWSWEIAEVDAKIDVAIKRQGQLKELEVTGEALLSDVLYTTPVTPLVLTQWILMMH